MKEETTDTKTSDLKRILQFRLKQKKDKSRIKLMLNKTSSQIVAYDYYLATNQLS
ncbi:MAG: hypothetical protein ACJAZ4_001182 [Neptuniibacter pectenicola]|jgi:hypothetical protein